MNKSELIEVLAKNKNLTFNKSEQVINAVFISLSDALRAGERIEIRGFGSFTIKDYKSYVGRNPKTGKPICVQSKKLPFFRVGKELKKRVAG